MTVRTFRRLAAGAFGLYAVAALSVAPRVLARVIETRRPGTFAIMVAPLVLVPLISLMLARNQRAQPKEGLDPNQSVPNGLASSLILFALVAASGYLAATEGLGIEVPRRFILAGFGLFFGAIGLTLCTPEPRLLPQSETGRWLAQRWRWGFVSLTGGSILAALFAADSFITILLMTFAIFAMPGETWGRERPAETEPIP